MAGGKKSYLKSYVLEKGKFVIPNNEGCQKAAENSWKGLVEAKKTKLRGNIWGGGYLRVLVLLCRCGARTEISSLELKF